MPHYLAADPSPVNGAPASTRHVELRSAGHTLHGVLHLPSGAGAHPAAVLLHGFPGWERNFDIAHALRRAGVASLVFHYRGCWGMPGRWSWANALADTEAVLSTLLQGDDPQMSELDPRRLAVVGHSLGGFLALQAASSRPEIGVVGSISGFDFGAVAAAVEANPALFREYARAFGSETAVLTGTDGVALAQEMLEAGRRWSLRERAVDFSDRDVLLIGTSRDDVTPAAIHHAPLVEAFVRAGSRLEHAEIAGDHSLAGHRVELTTRVVEFVLDRL